MIKTEYESLRKLAKTEEDKKQVEEMIKSLDQFYLACEELEEATKNDLVSWHFPNKCRSMT